MRRREFLTSLTAVAAAGCSERVKSGEPGGETTTEAIETVENSESAESTESAEPTERPEYRPTVVLDGIEVKLWSWSFAKTIRCYDGDAGELVEVKPTYGNWLQPFIEVTNISDETIEKSEIPEISDFAASDGPGKYHWDPKKREDVYDGRDPRLRDESPITAPTFQGWLTHDALRPGVSRSANPLFDVTEVEQPVLLWESDGKYGLTTDVERR